MTDPVTPLFGVRRRSAFKMMSPGRGGRVGGRGGPDRRDWTEMSAGCARVSGLGTEGGTPLSAIGGVDDGR